MKDYRKESLFFRLFHLPIVLWVRISLFLISSPGKRNNSFSEYITFYYILLSYSYFRYQKKYKYLIVDHGLIQQLASFLHNNEFQITDGPLNRFLAILNRVFPVYYVYCSLSSTKALDRIKLRNRNVGRIDKMKDETSNALFFLEKEACLFDRVSKKVKNGITVDMNQNINVIPYSIQRLLK